MLQSFGAEAWGRARVLSGICGAPPHGSQDLDSTTSQSRAVPCWSLEGWVYDLRCQTNQKNRIWPIIEARYGWDSATGSFEEIEHAEHEAPEVHESKVCPLLKGTGMVYAKPRIASL